METKLERIAEISANSPRPEFTSLYHLINKEMLLQCHKELDGNKAVGVDEITKKEYGRNLEQNIDDLVEKLKRKSYKPQPSIMTSKIWSMTGCRELMRITDLHW